MNLQLELNEVAYLLLLIRKAKVRPESDESMNQTRLLRNLEDALNFSEGGFEAFVKECSKFEREIREEAEIVLREKTKKMFEEFEDALDQASDLVCEARRRIHSVS